ncbi:MAG TPA: deoxyribodipyrimidine photo-lyase [Rubrobacter sp.]|nr:deoxyribodipyrimidine photo-lyase [Rubrobacter sp.]
MYWKQEAQRASYNQTPEYAVQRANELEQPLLVVFGLTADYPEANLRQYAFMLGGLKDAGEALEERGIQLAIYSGSPDEVALRSGENASMLVCVMSQLRLQKEWRERLAKEAPVSSCRWRPKSWCRSSWPQPSANTLPEPCGPGFESSSTTFWSSSSPPHSISRPWM